MLRRVLLTISTTLWLWGMYVLYSAVVTPRLQPIEVETIADAPVRRNGQESLERPAEFETLAQNYLPDAAWARRCRYQLHIDGAYLFTEKYERLSENKAERQGAGNRIRFDKFALIIMREKSKPEERPFTVIADGAEVTFAFKFDHLNPNPGRIVAGNLTGDVRILGPNGLWVKGETFFFAETNSPQLYSDGEVSFGYGRHSGRGRGLDVDFFPLQGVPPKDLPALDGVKTVRVRKDVHLELVRDGGKGKTGPAVGHSSRSQDETLLIDCQQNMVFDVPKLVLSLRDRVHVVQPTPKGHSNKMECETLELRLSTNDPKWGKVKGPKLGSWFPKRMELSGLVARGGDDHHPVKLRSPERDFSGEMAELQYDATTRTFIFRDDQKGVDLTQGAHRFKAPELRALLDAEQQLHTLHAPHEGTIHAETPKKEKFSAVWKKEMKMRPAEISGQDVLEFSGDAVLTHEQNGHALKGERILAWYSQKQEPEGKAGTSSRTTKSKVGMSDAETQQKFASTVLHRVFAEGQVEVDTPEFHARTGFLDMLFAESPKPLEISTKPMGGKPNRGTTTKEEPEKLSEAIDALEEKQNKPAARMPALIDAKKILVHLLRYRNDVAVTDVTADEQVQLQQARPNGEAPALARADQMKLFNRGEGDQDLQLFGNPAELSDQGSTLRGGKIFIWTKKNQALVDGPGQFVSPVKNSFDGKALKEPQMLTVNWQEKVEFDGKKVSFFDNVRAVLDDSWMTCSAMHVTLTEQIPFGKREPEGKGKKPEMARLECLSPVNFEQQTMEEGQLKMRSWGEAARFEMDKRTGKTSADGPGQIRVWQSRDGKSTAGSQKQLVRTSGESKNNREGWEYVQVDFEGKMEGNFSQKFTTFYEKVFVLYGQVADALEVIPRDELPEEGGTMECQELQVIQHESSKPGQSNVSLLGRKNVRLESRAFEGRADEINYDQSKNRYVLNSLGRETATVWHSPGGQGGERKVANARKWVVVVDGDTVKEMRVENSTGAGSGQ